MKRLILLSLIVSTVLLLFISCGSSRPARYEASFLSLFDTVTTIIGYADTKEDFSRMAEMIHDEIEDYHQLFDIYNDYDGVNNMKNINDHAGIAPVKVDQEIIDLLLFSKEMYRLTEGTVNVALGTVLEIWHTYREEGINDPLSAALPPLEALEEAAKHTDIEKVLIDEQQSTVFLEDPKMRLDVGAIAKGFATERVSEMLEEEGYQDVLLSLGGNVRAIGMRGKENSYWRVGIKNPSQDEMAKDLLTVQLTDQSLVTSGDYIRHYTVGGIQYHHIIDPATLFPAAYYAAVTILTRDGGLADALSTALFNMPYGEGTRLIQKVDQAEAFWVFPDGSTKESAGFREMARIDESE